MTKCDHFMVLNAVLFWMLLDINVPFRFVRCHTIKNPVQSFHYLKPSPCVWLNICHLLLFTILDVSG